MVAVHFVHDFAHPVLGFPWLRCPHVEVGDVVARLVPLHVSAQHPFAGDILRLGKKGVRDVHGEEYVKFGYKGCVTAHLPDQAENVMRHIKGIVPSVALDEALAVGGEQAVRLLPAAVAVAGAGEPDARVEHVAVVQRTLPVKARLRLPSVMEKGVEDRPVLVGVLQSDGDTVGAFVHRDVSYFFVNVGEVVIGHVGGGEHRLDRLCLPALQQSFLQRVGHHGNPMVTDHAPVLVAVMAPDGQHAVRALAVMGQE